jgi:UPF0755 protein
MTHRRPRRVGRAARLRRLLVGAVALVAVVFAGVFVVGHSGRVGGSPAPPPAKVVEVRPGQTADTVAQTMISVTGWDESTVAAAFADPVGAGVPAGVTAVEGWLGPGLYPVAPGDTAATLVAQMVAQQLQQLDALGIPAAAARQHRTVAQLVTIASVAQAEAIPSQYGQVARVITNRLAKGMPLQMDATLNYANGTHVLAHTSQQLTDKSAYNSYTRHGLPPTPIGNPDDRALRAAAAPPAGNWLYFVLIDKNGTQLFTADYAEFNRAKAKAQKDGVF